MKNQLLRTQAVPAVTAVAAATAAAGVAGVTTRVGATGGSSIRPLLATLHTTSCALYSCSFDNSFGHNLSPRLCTSNDWQPGTDWSTVSGVAALTSGAAVAASADGAAVRTRARL